MYFPIFSYFPPMIANFQLPTYMHHAEVVPAFSAPLISQPSQQPEAQENRNLQASTGRNVNQAADIQGGLRSQRIRLASRKNGDEAFGYRNQNKDRNIMSNILKAFFHHLEDKVGMTKFVEYLCLKFEIDGGVSTFFEFVETNFPKSKSYISHRALRSFLRSQKQPQTLLKILRLVINRFYRLEFGLILLKSSKTKLRSKTEQMKKSRQLLSFLFRE